MGFWIFMTAMTALLPAILLGLGRHFYHHPPQKINYIWGYRTKRSMQNQETWAFAHHYYGKQAVLFCKFLLPLSVIAMLPTYRQSVDLIGLISAIVCTVQIFVLFALIGLTEHALKKAFDENGRPKPPFSDTSAL